MRAAPGTGPWTGEPDRTNLGAGPGGGAGVSGRAGMSVWPTAQRPAAAQRGDRYPAEPHPTRMLPEIAATAIRSLTAPGELVFDPLCGAGTSLVEALYLGRVALGIDIDPRWATAARINLDQARRRVGGHGHVITADATGLPDALPPDFRDQITGRVSLLLTSWPGATPTHHHRASGANLTHQPPRKTAAGMAALLRGARSLLAPDGHVVITGRAWREHGELVDLPAIIADTLAHAGMVPVQHCVALLAGIRDGELVTRTSRHHRIAVARARAAGARWHLPCVEDVVIARRRPPGHHRVTPAPRASRPALGAATTDQASPVSWASR